MIFDAERRGAQYDQDCRELSDFRNDLGCRKALSTGLSNLKLHRGQTAMIFDAERRGARSAEAEYSFSYEIPQGSLMPKGVEHNEDRTKLTKHESPQGSLMPKGVEHLRSPYRNQHHSLPQGSLMPKGVEHPLRSIVRLFFSAPQGSLMPKGVEHARQAAVAGWKIGPQGSLMPKGVEHLCEGTPHTVRVYSRNDLGCRKALSTRQTHYRRRIVPLTAMIFDAERRGAPGNFDRQSTADGPQGSLMPKGVEHNYFRYLRGDFQ